MVCEGGGVEGKNSNMICYFLNASGYICSDCILIGDGEHWGMIDAGNRFEEKIFDEDGTIYDVSFDKALSSQEYLKNGKDIAEYIVNVLGITHLDFIMGTHAHSDHIGGVPYLAEIKTKDGKYLVDENTVYFYKHYQHVNSNSDDLFGKNSASWHSQAFEYQALRAMKNRSAKIIDLSMDDLASYSDVVQKVNSAHFTNVCYNSGEVSNNYDSYLEFSMGNISIRFYNLYHTFTTLDENVNSIVTVITGNGKSVCLLGDINTENQIEQKVCEAISRDIGTVDVLKAAHHGYIGSNTKEMVDFLQPKCVVVTRNEKWGIGEIAEDYLMPQRYYAGYKYDTRYYEVGMSDKGIMVQLNDRGIRLLEMCGVNDVEYREADSCINKVEPNNGWAKWINEIGESGENVALPYWYYFENGKPVTGWRTIEGHKYWFDDDGLMHTGWIEVGGIWFYTNYDIGVITGLNQLNWVGGTDWFYFDEEGRMQTGWKVVNGTECYFNKNTGALEKTVTK